MAYVKKSISFPERHIQGLQRAAVDDGHKNISRFIQDLVEAELRRRYGRDWATEFDLAQVIWGDLPTKEQAA